MGSRSHRRRRNPPRTTGLRPPRRSRPLRAGRRRAAQADRRDGRLLRHHTRACPRAHRVGDDVEDVVAFSTSLDESPGPCLPAGPGPRSPRPSTPSGSTHALCRSGRRRDGRDGLARAGPQLIRDRGNPATLKADGGVSIGSASSRVRRTPGFTGPSGRCSPATVTIRMNPGSRTRTRPSSPALRRLMSLVHVYGDEDA